MSGSKKISELDSLPSSEITDNDAMVIVDSETSSTKKVLISNLNAFYVTISSLESRIDDHLAELTTSILAEGDNLYYTQERFDTALAAKTTTDLTEGTQLYYTEERVSLNADVAANTAVRHSPLTLSTTGLEAGITLDGQELSMAKATSIQSGYLDFSDYAAMINKKAGGPQDLMGKFTEVAENVSVPTSITDLQFDEVDGFVADIVFVCGIDSDDELLQYFKHTVMFNAGVWSISSKINTLGDDSKIAITISTDGLGHGIVRYTSGAYTNFVSGWITYRADSY